MGAPISEMARSRQDTRRTWVYFAAVVVGVLAAVLRFLGVDNVEVVATLLFAVVFGATVLAGQIAGYLAAGLATALYAWMRRDTLDDVGATLFAVVVATRAVSYLVLAGVSHAVADRLPSVPLPGLMGRPWESQHGEARMKAVAAPHGDPISTPPGALWSGDQQVVSSTAEWAPGSEQAANPWEGGAQSLKDVLPASWGAMDDEEAAWGPPGEIERFDEFDELAELEGVASAGDLPQPTDHWGSTYSLPTPPPQVAPRKPEGVQTPADPWPVQPASPEMPRGWMNDEQLGDETIPVGLTGELFLPEMAGDAGPTPTGHSPAPDSGGVGHVDQTGADAPRVERPAAPPGYLGLGGQLPEIDPGTGLHTAHYLRDRLAAERDACRASGSSFSMVMVQIPDTPFQALPHGRQVALLRELGYQFGQAGMVDHLVHLPDGARHWFAVVLAGTDKPGARNFERRLRSAIAGYLRNRGLRLQDVESATLTSPDDDEPMAAIWSSLLGQPAGR